MCWQPPLEFSPMPSPPSPLRWLNITVPSLTPQKTLTCTFQHGPLFLMTGWFLMWCILFIISAKCRSVSVQSHFLPHLCGIVLQHYHWYCKGALRGYPFMITYIILLDTINMFPLPKDMIWLLTVLHTHQEYTWSCSVLSENKEKPQPLNCWCKLTSNNYMVMDNAPCWTVILWLETKLQS